MKDSQQTKAQLIKELETLRPRVEELQKAEAERERAGERLRESEELFRQMAESIKDVFWLSDPELDHIFYVSPAYEEVWGRSCASLYAAPKSFLDPIHTEDRARVFAALEEFRHGNWNLEYRILRPDGSIRWIRDRGFPIKDPSGQIYRMTGTATDITEHKEAEQRFFQSKRLATLGEAMTGLVHESRNILARIQAGVRMLSRRVTGDPDFLKFLNRIEKAQDDLHRLFEEVRQYAAPVNLKCEPTHLGKLLQETWEDLALLRKGRRARLREVSGGLDLHCEVDGFAIQQVFRNLLENALAACKDPVEISVEYWETLLTGQAALRMAVRDNGPGLTVEATERIFDAFYTTKTHGSGLGMSIAKRIIDEHRAELATIPIPDQGAEFLLTFPRRQASE